MFGIYPKSWEEILSIIEDCSSIDEVVIYGSRAKGNFKEGSDIDITLKGNVDKKDLNKLWHKLDDSFIPYKFDISIYNDLKSESLIEHIQRVGKIFYKRIN
ncbi:MULTISPECIES: nucleotidyltransferase domain-containing protein [Flavobacterium]|jgi:predicted nucleotidyltransferase|uniref:nucleotidyltransferase domain-containing protein n=1 Tax=Flavobacterium TaxID=237 RepID=UPI0022AC6D05|nr:MULTISPECIES: nucleotidyltransferase domain-containing protein [Flavobacterium]